MEGTRLRNSRHDACVFLFGNAYGTAGIPPGNGQEAEAQGNAAAALSRGLKVIEATYYCPASRPWAA